MMWMRRDLKKMKGERREFIGTFERLGEKSGWRGTTKTTVLLKDIVVADSVQHVADHLWFNYTKEFARIVMGGLKPGARVKFRARVQPYYKGYQGRRDDVIKMIELDYHLSRPTKIEAIDGDEPGTGR